MVLGGRARVVAGEWRAAGNARTVVCVCSRVATGAGRDGGGWRKEIGLRKWQGRAERGCCTGRNFCSRGPEVRVRPERWNSARPMPIQCVGEGRARGGARVLWRGVDLAEVAIRGCTVDEEDSDTTHALTNWSARLHVPALTLTPAQHSHTSRDEVEPVFLAQLCRPVGCAVLPRVEARVPHTRRPPAQLLQRQQLRIRRGGDRVVGCPGWREYWMPAGGSTALPG